MKTQKVILVTGASKGFGLEIAKTALANGDKVIATVRSKAAELAASLNNNPNLLVVNMDVTNEAQVKAAVEEGVAHFGTIDVLINNAGYGMVTAIEEATDAETKAQYATNVFGLLNVTRAVLPYLRAQRSGHIINISSLFGYGAYPGWALYGSTKFAVEGISKGLALELAPLGIKVTSAAPGLFSTEFLSAESYSAGKNIIEDYAATVGPMRAGADQLHGNQPGDPKKLAQVLVNLAHHENPPLHLPIGKDAVGMFKANSEKVNKEVDQWLEVSTGTDHDHIVAN
ncbi:NADP-dependent 3-hydroxy acid dehydrogenase YdfG [Mucilaginibacter oryzae]|uniref:NADP-dependent 3-hydroxy acid dehydrogenase YdfG n=1 Tax=Mucilaginibacter oryzae TaxID=468058 RepID=A0A316HAC1_9SPHI|nr:oxidoreductase [Mucilaginibacter oryzae]PWK78034.1 NADP-dependent 3-hydroxy acid dehydrogenase YdfG [Mucilaginibacter oryzae]